MPSPTPVLHIVASLGLGGTEKVMQLFATRIDKARFTPLVFAFADGERHELLRGAGVPVIVGHDLLGCLERLRPRIVHVHRAGWPEPERMRPIQRYKRAAQASGQSVGVIETNVFGRHDPSPTGKIVDRHLFVSHFCARRYAAAHGVDVDSPAYGVLYNPVDVDFLAEHAAPADDAPTVGRLCRPDPGKWSALALDCIAPLAARIPGFSYRIVGGTDHARAFVAEHGLDHCVTFLPPLRDEAALADFLGSIRVLAHANDTGESFGLAIAEAMAAGIPVVTHPCEGLRDNAQLELVDHGRTGLVAYNAAYADALAWLLDNPTEARRMGAAGQEKARRAFRVQDIVRQLALHYDVLLRLPSPLEKP